MVNIEEKSRTLNFQRYHLSLELKQLCHKKNTFFIAAFFLVLYTQSRSVHSKKKKKVLKKKTRTFLAYLP